MAEIPPGTQRLFPDLSPQEPEEMAELLPAAGFLLSRLLEDGDSADLRWLFATLPESTAAAWLERRGARRLSRRSRAFWDVVLDRSAEGQEPEAAAVKEALWLL
jgi:hypothetical protein